VVAKVSDIEPEFDGGVAEKVSHVSTVDGAFLEVIPGKVLSGVAALKAK
jgi:3-phosphoglycerate kinase